LVFDPGQTCVETGHGFDWQPCFIAETCWTGEVGLILFELQLKISDIITSTEKIKINVFFMFILLGLNM